MNVTFGTLDYNRTNRNNSIQGDYFYSDGIRIFYLVGALLSFLVSVASVIVNTLYIVCLYVNRKKEWFSRSKSILSIVVTDLMVGITSFWMTLTVSMANVQFYVCAISQSLCLSAQITTTLSILRLCLLRIISVRRSVPAREPSSRSILLQTFLTCTLSSIICFSPVFIWSKYSARLQRCTWSEIFQENAIIVDKFMLVVFIIPTLMTTTFYIFLSVYIKKKHTTVFPAAQTEGNQMTVWSTARSKTPKRNEASKVMNSNNADIAEATPSNDSRTRSNQCDTTATCTLNNQTRRKKGRNVTPSHVTAREKRLSNVVKTIGAILLCANASVFPYVLLLVLKIANWPTPVNPFYGFLTSFFLMLNSIADPLIYAVTLKHLREAFKQLLSKFIPCKIR